MKRLRRRLSPGETDGSRAASGDEGALAGGVAADKGGNLMLPREGMIERLRQICEQDEHVVAAMLYGSFPWQEADQFSKLDRSHPASLL